MTSNSMGIAVGIDGSSRADAAVRYAALEARRSALPLTLLHVLPDYVPMAPMMPLLPGDMREMGHSLLSAAVRVAAEAAPEVEVTRHLFTGHVATVLARESANAAQLVLGHESTHGWSRVFTGAVTMGAAARATCPVVSVPADWNGVPDARGRVVVGFKTSDHDASLLEHAFDCAAARSARLTILHAWELPSGYDDIIVRRTHDDEWNLAALERIEAQIAALRAAHPGVEVDVRVVHKQPALALREAAQDADLLMLGRRREGPSLLHLGGTARALLRTATSPVEVVPPVIHGPGGQQLVREHAGTPSS
jgi:nucleotide-binding universal stress UspA family protein